MITPKIREQINKYIDISKKHIQDILIVLIANVEGKSLITDDYKDTSVLSEYYTLEEYEALSTIYKKIGFEVLNYFSEIDFINAILNKELNRRSKKILVINTAQTGTYIGRKSLIPAFCEHLKIMYTGSNPYVVSLCRNKYHSGIIISESETRYSHRYLYSTAGKWINDKVPQIGEKVIAKLNDESASIGLSEQNIFNYSKDSEKYLRELIQKYKQAILVEPFIAGYEVELPVMVGTISTALLPAGIMVHSDPYMGNKVLDYSARFNHTYEFYNFEKIDNNTSVKIKKAAERAANILGISEFGRIDFRITDTGEYYISDIATHPHITMDGSYAYVFKELNYSYSDMLATQIGMALEKYNYFL